MRTLVFLAALAGCRDKAPAPAPALEIELVYPGASASLVETSVVAPIEQTVSQIPGVTHLEARIEGDHATLLVEVDRDLGTTIHEVAHAMPLSQLPAGLPPPEVRRAHREPPLLWLAIGGAQPVTLVSAYARDEVRPALQQIAGVAAVEAHALAEPRLAVWPDLDKLASLNVTLFDVMVAVQATEASSPEALGEVIVRPQVRLSDVARVEAGFARGAGEPMLAIRAHADADRDQVLQAVRAAVAKLGPPAGITLVEATGEPSAPALVATVLGPSLDELRAIADAYVKRAPELVVDPPVGEPEQTAALDRARATRYGIEAADVAATLRVIGKQPAGSATLDGVRRPIVIELPAMQLDEAARRVMLRTAQGELVPLAELVTVQAVLGHQILRVDRTRAIQVRTRGSVDAARRAIRAHPLPTGYRVKM